MTILDRYLGSRILSTLVKTMVSLVLLFVLIDLLTHRRGDIVRHEVPWHAVARYYAAMAPRLLYAYQIAALSMLVSALLVLGAAAQRNEVMAALAGGVGLRRLARMPVLIAAALAVAVFVMQETIGVRANREVERLDAQYFPESGHNKRPGVSWARLEGGWTCHVMKFNRIALTGENVFMHAIRPGVVEQIQAHRIFWDPDVGQWLLEDGRWFVFNTDKDWEGEVQRITQRAAPIRESPEVLFALDRDPDTKTVGQLAADIRRARRHGIPVRGHWADLHAKFSIPALSFVMIWLAIPFAMRLRRGGLAIGFGVSIAIALTYLMVFRVTMGLGHIERLGPAAAAWSANLAFLAFGLVLFRKTPT